MYNDDYSSVIAGFAFTFLAVAASVAYCCYSSLKSGQTAQPTTQQASVNGMTQERLRQIGAVDPISNRPATLMLNSNGGFVGAQRY